MRLNIKCLILINLFFSFPVIVDAAATCATSKEDAEYVCSLHLYRQNCSCKEIHSAAKQCFAYGKYAYQCSWN